MIGQKNNLDTIKNQLYNNTFPHFSIIVGPKGSGKKTLAHSILKLNHKYFNGEVALEDVKVDSIRNMVDDSYKYRNVLFIIPDADGMSLNAKNALLKVVEECPNNNYYVMTLEDDANTLDTIKSRGTIYRMESYTVKELATYIDKYYLLTSVQEERDIARELCDTPGEVDLLMEMNGINFYEYVEKVLDNITEVSGANAFKIGDEIALKNEDDNYDLKLFFKAFMRLCLKRYQDLQGTKYLDWITITGRYLRDLRITGINKQMLFDSWILEIRSTEI